MAYIGYCMTLVKRTYRVGKHHDIIVKRIAKKLQVSESEVVRRRIRPYEELLKELQEDMKHADFINIKRYMK